MNQWSKSGALRCMRGVNVSSARVQKYQAATAASLASRTMGTATTEVALEI